MDRLESMQIFVKAVELGSFSAAADALEISPQLVGKNVRTLEQHLGVRLLNRTTRRQSVTEIGATFFERARIILAEVEAAETLAAETRATPRGRLRVNAPVTFGIHALAPRLHEYLREFPDVSVDVTLANRLVDVVDEGFDAVFRIGELTDSGLMAKALEPYKLVLCAAPSYLASRGHPKTPADLIQHECLGFSSNTLRSQWEFEGPHERVTVPISSRVAIDSGEALLRVAVAGMGILLQPLELVESDLASGRLIRLLPRYKVPVRPLHILYAPDRRMTPKLRSFLDFAVKCFGKRPAAEPKPTR